MGEVDSLGTEGGHTPRFRGWQKKIDKKKSPNPNTKKKCPLRKTVQKQKEGKKTDDFSKEAKGS